MGAVTATKLWNVLRDTGNSTLALAIQTDTCPPTDFGTKIDSGGPKQDHPFKESRAQIFVYFSVSHKHCLCQCVDGDLDCVFILCKPIRP